MERDRPSGCRANLGGKPVSIEEAVVDFERRHGLKIPADYRAFITTVSSGRIGPAYGLVPFDETVKHAREVAG